MAVMPPRTANCLYESISKVCRRTGLRLEEAPRPTIGINDVLIRVQTPASAAPTSTSTSGTVGAEDDTVGLIIGHEFVGEIVEVGSNVSGLRQEKS